MLDSSFFLNCDVIPYEWSKTSYERNKLQLKIDANIPWWNWIIFYTERLVVFFILWALLVVSVFQSLMDKKDVHIYIEHGKHVW